MAPRRHKPATAAIPAALDDAPDAEAALAALGLTPLEAEVYRFLLGEPGATGYRIAQGLGRPVGNIYKAVEGLETKGAVASSDDGGNRTARAIAVPEWLQARRAQFDRACAVISADLSQARTERQDEADDDDLVYRLTHRDQVVARSRAIIESARRFIVATVAPALVAELADALRAAAERIPVAVKCFEPVTIEGVEIIMDPRGGKAVAKGPGAWLVLSADGRDSLCALFDPPGRELRMATWSRNPLLAWVQFSGLSSDLVLAALRQRIATAPDSKVKRDLVSDLKRLEVFESDTSSGKLAIERRYRMPSRRTVR